MSTIRKTEPTQITQGEALTWTREFCDHPATLWDLQYRFRGVGTGFDADAVEDPTNGTGFLVEVPATATADMGVGKYDWQAWMTEIADATNKIMVAEGTVKVYRGFSSGEFGTVDLRSSAKKIVDAIDAALLVDATSNVISYEITTPAGTRKVQRSRNEAIAMRKEYAMIVARENAAERTRNGGKFGKTIVMNVRER